MLSPEVFTIWDQLWKQIFRSLFHLSSRGLENRFVIRNLVHLLGTAMENKYVSVVFFTLWAQLWNSVGLHVFGSAAGALSIRHLRGLDPEPEAHRA